MSGSAPRPLLSATSGAEPCAVCRMPLAPEQRYCMRCGARRAGTRLEFVDVLGEDQRRWSEPPPAAVTPTPERPTGGGFLTQPAGLAGVVLVSLLVGLFTGRWIADPGDPAPPANQTIRVVGGGSAAGAAAPAAKVAKKKAKAGALEPDDTKITREHEQEVLDDASGNQNLAPKDDNPNGANFDEIPAK